MMLTQVDIDSRHQLKPERLSKRLVFPPELMKRFGDKKG